MFKKYLPLIILLLIAIPVTLFYFFFRNVESKDQRGISFEAVPENAIVLLENQSATDFFQTLSSARRVKESLALVDELSPANAILNHFDTLLQQGAALPGKMRDMPFYLSIHQTGDNKFDFFIK